MIEQIEAAATDVPLDYHMTALGPLPEDWDVTRLGDLFDIQQGKALSPKARTGESHRPFLRTANVLWGQINLQSVDSMDFSPAEFGRLTLQSGDLLICEGGDIGRTALWSGQIDGCCYQNHLHRLRPWLLDVDPEFYMYWMQAAYLLLKLYGGEGNKTTIPNLSKARLSSFLVPLPPLPEQRAIAQVLGTVQHAKEATEAVIAVTRELKKSLMRHLFTYGPVPVHQVDRVVLKETEIGLVPGEWEVVPLGYATVQTQYGLSVRGERTGQYPILRMNCFAEGSVGLADLQYVNLDDATFRRFRLNRGDILFNRTNSYELVGKVGLFDHEGLYTFASYLVRVATDQSKLLPSFLNYYLNAGSVQGRLKMVATRGASQSNISASKLREFAVPLPPISEQMEISQALSAVDKRLQIMEQRRAALESLFKTLLQNLMVGRVRVTGH